MDICTAITRNHVAGARVLAESHATIHPDATCTVLVVDDHDGWIDPENEPFEMVRPDEIEIGGFYGRAGYYSAMELVCSVKPALLAHVLERSGVAAYLDSDIEVYGSLSGLAQNAREHGIVLTPHSLSPLPNDELPGNQFSVIAAGPFNAGFIAASDAEEPMRILAAWDQWLRTECLWQLHRGICVDQTWAGLIPSFAARFHVERDPGCNVAYWNLMQRTLSKEGDTWMVNGTPLRFFHFSRFDPERPGELLDIDHGRGNIGGPDLEELLASYSEKLLASGWRETRSWSYGYSSLPNGLELNEDLRSRYRLALERGEIDQPLFSAEGAERFGHLLESDILEAKAEAERAAAAAPAGLITRARRLVSRPG